MRISAAAVSVGLGLGVASGVPIAAAHPSDPGVVSYAVLGKGSVGNIVGGPMGSESVFTEPVQGFFVDLPDCNNWADIGLPEVYNDPDLASFNGATAQTSANDQTHFVKQSVGVFATNDAAGRAFHRAVDRTVAARVRPPRCIWITGRRKCGHLLAGRQQPPTRTGPSRKRAPIAAASIKPDCVKTCCSRRRFVRLATRDPRSMSWPGRCKTRWGSSPVNLGIQVSRAARTCGNGNMSGRSGR
jgi:hypothetical protein